MQMREGDFSQLPVYDDSRFVALLTAETIARWMAQELRENEGLIEEVPVSEVLPHAESAHNVTFLGRAATVFDALESFAAFFHRGYTLNSILITETGVPDQHPLGIVTVTDIPAVTALTR